jgi:hypothetical protein
MVESGYGCLAIQYPAVFILKSTFGSDEGAAKGMTGISADKLATTNSTKQSKKQ